MSKILVTGGAGYIGSHTIIDLIANGYEVVSIDNFSNSFPSAFDQIETITGVAVQNYNVDLCVFNDTKFVFDKHPDIIGVIHFAAFKYVNESVNQPLKYYHNNVNSLLNVLQCCKSYNIQNFVFSSSCSVYGNASEQPVKESTPIGKAQSPYAQTKLICEQMIIDFASNYSLKHTMLRYFNPIGGHLSGEIGESPKAPPQNILPKINAVVKGLMPSFQIAGSDYPTKDGTCVRDYIHVSDVAHAHTLALQELQNNNHPFSEVYNLGSGTGTSVLEIVQAFEKANHLSLNYVFSERRPGDVAAIYADTSKAKNKLGWQPQYSLEEMLRTAWEWENKE